MNIHEILEIYDQMFGKCSLIEIESFLLEQLNKAKSGQFNDVVFTLINEIIGFYRDITNQEKAFLYCDELILLMDKMNLTGSFEYATSLLNIANAYRAFGRLNESVALFLEVEKIYKKQLSDTDFGFANLYNNFGLVYQELNRHNKAVEVLTKALNVVDQYKDASIQQAITRVNLSNSLNALKDRSALTYLNEALHIFEMDEERDFHYSGALVAMADAYINEKNYKKAKLYYQEGLQEIEKHTGRNKNYDRVKDKLDFCIGLIEPQTLLEESRLFYETKGRAMIETYFKGYEERIAVGMVGEGSDCFGFDDEISSDHDYDIGFCMWLCHEDYMKIGQALQKQYEAILPRKHNGHLQQRRGVFEIESFYKHLLNTPNFYIHSDIPWNELDEANLAIATNGEVFRDDLGLFTSIRHELLTYYPNDIYHFRLATELHDFCQYAQSNYPRMMARGDVVTASLCKIKAVESAMNLVYLFEKRYAPYYKWKRKGLEKSLLYKKIKPYIDELILLSDQSKFWEHVSYHSNTVYTKDRCVMLFEKIAEIFVNEMREKDLIYGDGLFLERYVNMIEKGKKEALIDEIIALEWEAFDQVIHIDGRASCQDDPKTFEVMRKSQYRSWNEDVLLSYEHDLFLAKNQGRNLMTEKYARMMVSTDPVRYNEFKDTLPALDERRIAIQEQIVAIQVSWMQDFSEKYPYIASLARVIQTKDDQEDDTSFETYLRGELGTYSEQTLILYARMIVDMVQQKRNITEAIMKEMMLLSGFDSLKEANAYAKKEREL